MKKYLLMIVLLLSACTDVETCNLQCQKNVQMQSGNKNTANFNPTSPRARTLYRGMVGRTLPKWNSTLIITGDKNNG